MRQQRALRTGQAATFLHDRTALQISERLTEVNRSFTKIAIVSGFTEPWRAVFPNSTIVPEIDTLPFAADTYDLIIHALALHACNDPLGQLIQCHRALKKDGLFIAALFGGQTLHELRATLAYGESEITGGISPRVFPMAEIRDLGALLQRANFSLPVADNDVLTVTYKTLLTLMHDLRAMGESNILSDRLDRFTASKVFSCAEHHYQLNYCNNNNLLPATFEVIFLTGWRPDESQQQPLKPGSAQTSLQTALNAATQDDLDPDAN